MKEAGDKISDNAKIAANFIKDKSQKALNSDFVQGITKTAESGINVVIEKTKILLNKNENQNNNDVVLDINEQRKNDVNEPNLNQNDIIQMSNVINDGNINNINELNNNVNNENKIEGEVEKKDEIKNEEKKEEINQNEGKIEEKKLEDKLESGNSINNNLIENKKVEEENVKSESENQK